MIKKQGLLQDSDFPTRKAAIEYASSFLKSAFQKEVILQPLRAIDGVAYELVINKPKQKEVLFFYSKPRQGWGVTKAMMKLDDQCKWKTENHWFLMPTQNQWHHNSYEEISFPTLEKAIEGYLEAETKPDYLTAYLKKAVVKKESFA